MNIKPKQSLLQSLLSAIYQYDFSLPEEQGGFIMIRKDEYKFVPVKNKNTGTIVAHGLYIPEHMPFEDDGWEIYASYHTHPEGMRAMPSGKDIAALFTSFPINYIFAPDMELNRFEYKTYVQYQEKQWHCTNVMTFNGFNTERHAITYRKSWSECETNES